MRAMVFDRYGDSGMLCLRNVPVPELQDGEVLIRVGYAGVNPLRVTGTQCAVADQQMARLLDNINA